jgi:hypothetical protein
MESVPYIIIDAEHFGNEENDWDGNECDNGKAPGEGEHENE